jgi:hypothetical protein
MPVGTGGEEVIHASLSGVLGKFHRNGSGRRLDAEADRDSPVYLGEDKIGKGLAFIGVEQKPLACAALRQNPVNSPVDDEIEQFLRALLIDTLIILQRGHNQTLVPTDFLSRQNFLPGQMLEHPYFPAQWGTSLRA